MKLHQTAQTGLIIHSNPTSKDPNSNVIERLRDVLWFSVRIAYNYGKRPRKHLEKSFASTCMLYNHIQTLAINRQISALKFSKHAHTIYLLNSFEKLNYLFRYCYFVELLAVVNCDKNALHTGHTSIEMKQTWLTLRHHGVGGSRFGAQSNTRLIYWFYNNNTIYEWLVKV